MSPFGPEIVTPINRRLPQRQTRRGCGGATGLGTVGGFLFGAAFVGAGMWMLLAGLKVIPIDARKLHVPFWVLALLGAVFLLPGLWVWAATLKARLDAQRRDRRALAHGEDARAQTDYPWDTSRWEIDRWASSRRLGFGAVFMTVFMTAVGYIVYFERGTPGVVKVFAGIFVLAAVWCWLLLFREIWRAWKFGVTAVAYERFPMKLGEIARLRWIPPRRLLMVDSGQVTLRCVREWTEIVGSGKNRSVKICHESAWESVREVDAGTPIRPTDDIEVSFALPADQPGTCLSAAQTVTFWELEIRLAVPGLDFCESYLVPVYA